MLLLTFGAIEYGWTFIKAQQITNAARHAARVAVTPDATTADVEGAAAALMAASGIGGYQLTMPVNVEEASLGDTVTVTIQVPYANVGLGGPTLLPLPNELHASTSMAKEGP